VSLLFSAYGCEAIGIQAIAIQTISSITCSAVLQELILRRDRPDAPEEDQQWQSLWKKCSGDP
jgi:hypothetical protein